MKMTMRCITFLYLALIISTSTSFTGVESKVFQNSPFISEDREDDYEDAFELSDIIALSLKPLDQYLVSPTDEERQAVVDLHNDLRRNFTYPVPNASDMNMLEYNKTLEWGAGLYVDACRKGHHFGKKDNTTATTGQCLYTGAAMSPSRGIYLFYHREIPWYYFNNFTCWEPQPPYQCGHLVQVMMSISQHIGFNRKYCVPRQKIYFIGYHYLFGGVGWTPDVFHFKYGVPCSNCFATYQCSSNLCIPYPKRFCKAYNIDCECKRICHNCGTPDWENCKCLCKLGWDYDDCSFPCQNTIEVYRKAFYCGFDRATIQAKCQKLKFYTDFCRKTCGVCLPVNKNVPNGLCCSGKICPEHYILDSETCECKLKCPSVLCLYYTNVTSSSTSTALTTIPSTSSTIASTTTTTTAVIPIKKKEPTTSAPSTTPSTTAFISIKNIELTASNPSTSSTTSTTTNVIAITEKEPVPNNAASMVILSFKMLLIISLLTISNVETFF